MELINRFKKDFGKDYDSFGYQANFANIGAIKYVFYCVYSIKNYNQFSLITTEEINEDFVKIPELLLALRNSDKVGVFNVYGLLSKQENFTDIPHNRNVYIYCYESKIERQIIVDYFLKFNLRVIIRDKDYFNMQKADFFISHDSKDKDKVARPLYHELIKRGYKVWFDEYSLNIGDSLTESIEKGIAESKFGIIILSKSFLSNERWAKNELQSIKTKQIFNNEIILLPVWHNINEFDLKEHYWLLDKLGGNTKNGIKKLVDQLENKIKSI